MSSPRRPIALGLLALLSSGCGLLIEPAIPWTRAAADAGTDLAVDVVGDLADDLARTDAPDVVDAFDAPDVVDAPDVPSVPDAPDVPPAPDVPDVPSIDAPDGVDAPDDAPDGVDAPVDRVDVPDVCVPVPRLKFPLSGSVVTTTQPTLRWQHASCGTPIRLELCRDRACTSVRLTDTPSVPGSYRIPVTLDQLRTYFWRIRYGAGLTSVTPTWAFRVASYDIRLTRTATAWGRFHDGDGDGYADLALGLPVPTRLGPVARQGVVLVWRGGPFFTSTLTPPIAPPITITAPTGADAARGFGSLVASASDVNGDGLGDLLIASRNGDAAVWLAGVDGGDYVRTPGYAVQPSFPPPGRAVTLPAVPATGLGDFDGDGYADVAYTRYDPGGANGQINVTFGGPSPTVGGSVVVVGYTDGRVPGFALAAAGDVDGDGRSDLVVGEPALMASGAGRLSVYLGNEGRALVARSVDVPESDFGSVIAGATDVDGDGRADVVTLAPTSSTVRVYGWDLAGSRLALRQTLALRPELTRLAPAGDINGDGRGDVMAWSPDGVEQLLLGSASGLVVAASARIMLLDSDLRAVACAGPLADRSPGTLGEDADQTDDLVSVWVTRLLGTSRASITVPFQLGDPDGGVRWGLTEGRVIPAPLADLDFGASIASAW